MIRVRLAHIEETDPDTRWKPWEKSTGPKSEEGKAKVSQNGFKGGHRPMLRELARALLEQAAGLTRIG
ncbi:MAG: hypothetical protein M3436_01940 [Pseudomonadota bacterium]|nr:hypothetical protein [Pseudomonadota bacterium]